VNAHKSTSAYQNWKKDQMLNLLEGEAGEAYDLAGDNAGRGCVIALPLTVLGYAALILGGAFLLDFSCTTAHAVHESINEWRESAPTVSVRHQRP